jgi:hypothetical protein
MEAQDHRLDPIVVGALFKDKAELKMVCQNAATSGNFEYSIIKSDSMRLTKSVILGQSFEMRNTGTLALHSCCSNGNGNRENYPIQEETRSFGLSS